MGKRWLFFDWEWGRNSAPREGQNIPCLAYEEIHMFKNKPFFSSGRNILKEGILLEHLCESLMNLNQWFRRCHLKIFLSLALVAILFSRVEMFVQFC